MNSMKRLALACCLLALPVTAWADGDYRFELTPHVSYHFGGTLQGDDTGPYDTDLELADGVAYGVAFDMPLSNNLQLELLVNQQDSDLFYDGGIFGPDLELTEMEVTYAHVGLLVQFGQPAVSPYFVVSAGLTNLDAKGPGAGSDTRFSVSAGGGVKAFFTDHFGLRFEGRGFWTQADDYEATCHWDGYSDNCYGYNDYLSQFETSLGLIFAW